MHHRPSLLEGSNSSVLLESLGCGLVLANYNPKAVVPVEGVVLVVSLS
jgi:hypothetical protein